MNWRIRRRWHGPEALSRQRARVQDRPVPRRQHGHGGPRGDDRHRAAGRLDRALPVAARRPGQQPAVVHQPGRPADIHHGPGREPAQRRPVRAPDAGPGEPAGVQPRVDFRGAVRPADFAPDPLERLVIPVAAFPAGPVPGGEPGGLVEEVQLGQPPRRPLLPAPALEREHADDPGLPAGVAGQPALAVQELAAVTPEHAAIRHGDQLTVRRYPVLPWHGNKPPSASANTFSRRNVAIRIEVRPRYRKAVTSAVFDAAAAASQVVTALLPQADSERAGQAKRYLKSDLDFLGVSVPAIRSAVRDVARTRNELDRDGALAWARALWRGR